MIQKVARFLLVLLAYPTLPMQDPGTSYAPSVYAARERKGSQNLLWFIAWYIVVVGLVAYFGRTDTGWSTAGIMIIVLPMILDWKLGLVIAWLIAVLGGSKVVIAAVAFFICWWLLTAGLEFLAIDPRELHHRMQE